jgi:hypothetical protein
VSCADLSPSVLWRNRQTEAYLVFSSKPRNRRGDFETQITKPELLVLRPKLGNHTPPWFWGSTKKSIAGFEAKPGETIATSFETKLEKTVATNFEAKLEKTIAIGFEAQTGKPSTTFGSAPPRGPPSTFLSVDDGRSRTFSSSTSRGPAIDVS